MRRRVVVGEVRVLLQRGRHVVGRCRPLAFEVGGVVAGSGSGEARPVVGRRRTVVVHRCRRRVVGSPVEGGKLDNADFEYCITSSLGKELGNKAISQEK